MDLTKQPPRRPSNIGLAGLVGLARMADKARAHRDQTLGEYKYGERSGLDRDVLEFIGMGADEFAELVAKNGDDGLESAVKERLQKSTEEVVDFNAEYLRCEPQDDFHRKLLEERVAKFVPGSTGITTVLQSMELDDWGAFRDRDLTARPPRTPYLRSVTGVVTLARMSDKTRAATVGKLGNYKYGESSGFDRRVMEFLGIEIGAFTDAAYKDPNDHELGEWVWAHTHRTKTEISAFNAERTSFGMSGAGRERLNQLRSQLCPERVEIEHIFDLLDYDDQNTFGIIDLNRRPPRSPYDTSVGGLTGIARMIDKGRALRTDTLGGYWFGNESGNDRSVLDFLDLTAEEFLAGLEESDTDDKVVTWMGSRLEKPEEVIEQFNRDIQNRGASNERQWQFLYSVMLNLDPSRTDIESFAALTLLDDQIYFSRLRSPV